MQENPIKDTYWLSPFLILPIPILYLWYTQASWEVSIISLTIYIVIVIYQFIQKSKFRFKLVDNNIEVKQLGRKASEISCLSITRIYIQKTPFNRLFNVCGLVIESGKKSTFREQLMSGGPVSMLGSIFASPGIWNNYLSIPHVSLSDAERIKNSILDKCVEPKPEVSYIGMFHP